MTFFRQKRWINVINNRCNYNYFVCSILFFSNKLVMIIRKKNTILLITFLIILLSIISALVIENIFGHHPCKLCIYERIPYFFSILLIISIFFFRKYEKNIFFILFLIFIFSSIMAFYHFGIEQGFFNETLVCTTGDLSKTMSKEQILEQLEQNVISCKDISFKILGLSLAAINTILSLILSFIFLGLFCSYGSNSTSQYK